MADQEKVKREDEGVDLDDQVLEDVSGGAVDEVNNINNNNQAE